MPLHKTTIYVKCFTVPAGRFWNSSDKICGEPGEDCGVTETILQGVDVRGGRGRGLGG